MSWLPEDPEGFTAQPLSHRDLWPRCYELHLVYDPAGRLVRDACRWFVMRLDVDPLDPDPRPESSWISYRDYARTFGRRALPFRQFRSAELPPEVIDGWIAAAARRRRRIDRERRARVLVTADQRA
jgi:hypothetical protein